MSAQGDTGLIDQDKVKPLILWFIGLTAVFSMPVWWLQLEMGQAYLYIMAAMWVPAVAALTACRIIKVDFSILGFAWGKHRWILMSYLIPLVYILIIYLITWVGGYGDFFNDNTMEKMGDKLGLHGWSDGEVALLAIPLTAIFILPRQLASVVGEEIGWRGLLAPQLMRLMNFPLASITSGAVWFAWHIPIIVWGSYMIEDRPENWQIACYAIMLISMSFPMMYYRLKSGSLWTGAVFHGAHNLFFYNVFYQLTEHSKWTKFYAGEWGMITATVLPIVAAIYWYKAHSEGLSGQISAD